MTWEHEWGSRLKTVIGHAERSGLLPRALEDAPMPIEWARPIWEAYLLLNRQRPYYLGFADVVYGAIPLTEVIAYLDFIEVRGWVERQEWLEIIAAMDDAYLALVNKEK